MITVLSLSPDDLRGLRSHLFTGDDEQAAFGYAHCDVTGTFRISAIDYVPPEGFAFQSDYHIELTGDVQAQVIKRAFDLRACLVEFHSHRTSWPARFSGSDFRGFDEFVPHVRWRLAGRPYAAVVFHETSFDALHWTSDTAEQIARIECGDETHPATGLSLRALGDDHGR